MNDRADCVVLLDIDGTLVDSTYHHALAWHRAFARHDITLPMWRIHRTVGMGGDKLVGEVAGDEVEKTLGDALRDGWAEEYAALVDQVAALPGASELVHRLAGDGYLVALASSGEKKFSEIAVRVLGIADDIHAVTSSGDAEDSKPDPDILGVTLDRVPASKAVLVGDTTYDVEAAGRIGLACIGVLTGGFSRAELDAAGAALVVEDLTELLELDWSTHLRAPTN
jgi:HAD superfamily hydrolase (TIGR01549 family)